MRYAKLAVGIAAAALAGSVHAYDLEDWPTHYTFSDGTDLGLVLVYRYDVNDFSDDRKPDGSDAFEDSATNRRKELGLSLKKKGVYEAIVDYEYQGKTWLDTNVRFYSKRLLRRRLRRIPLRLFEDAVLVRRQHRDESRFVPRARAAVAGDVRRAAHRHRLAVRAPAIRDQCRLLLGRGPPRRQRRHHVWRSRRVDAYQGRRERASPRRRRVARRPRRDDRRPRCASRAERHDLDAAGNRSDTGAARLERCAVRR